MKINAMDANSLKVAEDPKAKFESTSTSADDVDRTSTGALAIKDTGSYDVEKLEDAKDIGLTANKFTGAKYLLRDNDDKIVGASINGKEWKMVTDGNENDSVNVSFENAETITLDSTVISGTIKIAGATNGASGTEFTLSGTATVDFEVGATAIKSGIYTVGAGDDKLLYSDGNEVAKLVGGKWQVGGNDVLTTVGIK